MHLSAPIFRLKRDAKLLARADGIPLHEAQDLVAQREGYRRWSHLAAQHAQRPIGARLLAALQPGDLAVLGGKRDHGKTTLAFELIAHAVADRRRCAYFSLEENDIDIEHLLRAAGVDPVVDAVIWDTSDDITAETIAASCRELGSLSLVVVDYLQLLDQQRRKAPLADQVELLEVTVRETQSIVILLAQIDRSFDLAPEEMPGLAHLRLPNPIDAARLTKACFIHNGEIAIGPAA